MIFQCLAGLLEDLHLPILHLHVLISLGQQCLQPIYLCLQLLIALSWDDVGDVVHIEHALDLLRLGHRGPDDRLLALVSGGILPLHSDTYNQELLQTHFNHSPSQLPLYHHSCQRIIDKAKTKGYQRHLVGPCPSPMIIRRECKLYQLNRMAEQFAAAPKVVKPKNKYKEQPQEQQEDEIKLIYNNLMWDKRIFRGNTYSAIVISKKNDNNYDQQPKIPVRTIRQPQETASAFESSKRANIEIFTDQFVESLTDKPPRYEYASQTDPLPDRPVIRHRIADKIGQDIETQIWDNELFDFDYEVEPLLNVLCGRTLEMSRMEVLQEEELKIMSNRQQELRLYEREENKKIQNMYDQEDKLQKENLKNIQNFKKEKEKKVKTHKKVFARVVAKQFLRDIKANTLSFVEGNGFFRNTIDTRLISQVLPKFYQETAAIANEDIYYHNEANKILDDARQLIVKEHAWAKEVERTRRNQIIAKREEVAREKKERKGMEAEERKMRQFLAEEKVFLEQEEQRKREEQAKEEAAVEQS